jgi:hypothetical protein
MMNASKPWSFGRSSGAQFKTQRAESAGVLFPLTPTLSPRRGRALGRRWKIRTWRLQSPLLCLSFRRHTTTKLGCIIKARANVSPSPCGEREHSDGAGKFGRCGCSRRFFVFRFGGTRQPNSVVLSKHGRRFLPLLGERAGVRGNEANFNSRRPTIPGTVKSSRVPRQSRDFSNLIRSNTKHQAPSLWATGLVFGVWLLDFGACLELGAWSLELLP